MQDSEGLRETGRFYGVSPVCIEGVAHDMMLDCSWDKGAEVILSWLNGLNKQQLVWHWSASKDLATGYLLKSPMSRRGHSKIWRLLYYILFHFQQILGAWALYLEFHCRNKNMLFLCLVGWHNVTVKYVLLNLLFLGMFDYCFWNYSG